MKEWSMTYDQLADIDQPITSDYLEHHVSSRITAYLLDYFRWLAEQDTGLALTAGMIWSLYYEYIKVGRVLSEVCEDMGLPVRSD